MEGGKRRRGEGMERRRGEGRGGEGRRGKGKERAMSPPTIWRKFTPMGRKRYRVNHAVFVKLNTVDLFRTPNNLIALNYT